jgi:hypothetical protein
MTSDRPPWDITAADAGDERAAAAAAAQVARRVIVALLVTAAALDLTRCALVLTAARHPAPRFACEILTTACAATEWS